MCPRSVNSPSVVQPVNLLWSICSNLYVYYCALVHGKEWRGGVINVSLLGHFENLRNVYIYIYLDRYHTMHFTSPSNSSSNCWKYVLKIMYSRGSQDFVCVLVPDEWNTITRMYKSSVVPQGSVYCPFCSISAIKHGMIIMLQFK